MQLLQLVYWILIKEIKFYHSTGYIKSLAPNISANILHEWLLS